MAVGSRRSMRTGGFDHVSSMARNWILKNGPKGIILLSDMATIQTYELEIFREVVLRRSFTAAADALGSDKAYLSRVVTKLEARFGTKLLQRSTRSLSLTEAGREFYQRATGILDALYETEALLDSKQSEPSGTLRLTSGVEFGTLAVNDWICKYLKMYPQMRVEYEETNRILDIIHEGHDIAIRVGDLKDSNLSVRKFGEFSYSLYATPAYLETIPPLKLPENLEQADFIAFSLYSRGLRLTRGQESYETKQPAKLVASGNSSVKRAVMGHLGIALLPDVFMKGEVRSGDVTTVLSGWSRPSVPVHAVFPSSKYLTVKVRAFIDLALEEFRKFDL
jgi:LysR family transcriptional regulator, regulator for bpeEF and oprC